MTRAHTSNKTSSSSSTTEAVVKKMGTGKSTAVSKKKDAVAAQQASRSKAMAEQDIPQDEDMESEASASGEEEDESETSASTHAMPSSSSSSVSQSGKKNSSSSSMGGPASIGKTVKKRNNKQLNYNAYIFKMLKEVDPKLRISKSAMSVMNSLVLDVCQTLATEASTLARYSKKDTLTPHDLESAVRLVIPGDLSRAAAMQGTDALKKYRQFEIVEQQSRPKPPTSA